MDPRMLQNFAAICGQVAAVAAIGGVLPWALRVQAPHILYPYFRTLLALTLLLPIVQPWHAPAPRPVAPSAGTAPSAVLPAMVISDATVSRPLLDAADESIVSLAVAVLGAGIVVRLAWLAIGFARLRRLRRMGVPMPLPPEVADLPEAVGAHAELRWVHTLSQPVTFGVRHPVVLLPASLAALALAQQRTVIAHELFHVQRRDWLWAVGEELLRAVFWFHPAMWWLISRIQLAREQVVDELTVLATGNRRAYMEALLAYGDRSPLAPVTAFARRRHLFTRIALISREAAMSPKRVAASCGVMSVVIVVTAWFATSMFPLEAVPTPISTVAAQATTPGLLPPPPPPPPPPPDGAVAAEGRILKVEHRVEPVYPPEARAAEARGQITLALTIDAVGNVTSSHVRAVNIRTSKNVDATTIRDATDAVIRAATDAVQQWRYKAPGRTTIANATIEIHPPGEATRTVISIPHKMVSTGHTYPPNALRVGGVVKPPAKTYHVNPVYPAVAQKAGIEGIVILETLIDEAGTVAQAHVVKGVPLLDQAALDAVKDWRFQPTLMNGAPVPVIMTTTVSFMLDDAAARPLPPPPAPGAKKGQPISMALNNADLRELLQFFALTTGQKVDVDPAVTGTVSVSFDNASWREALEAIARAGKLSYTVERDVIRVAPRDGRQ